MPLLEEIGTTSSAFWSFRTSAFCKHRQFWPSFSGVVLPTQQFKHIALQWVL